MQEIIYAQCNAPFDTQSHILDCPNLVEKLTQDENIGISADLWIPGAESGLPDTGQAPGYPGGVAGGQGEEEQPTSGHHCTGPKIPT